MALNTFDRMTLGELPPGDATKFLNGTGEFSAPPSSSVVAVATTTLTSAQLKALRANPVILVPAQGNGKAIKSIAYFVEYRAGGTPYTIPSGVNFHIEMAANPADYGFNMTPSGFIDQSSNQAQSFSDGSDVFGPTSDVNNTPIQITLTGGAGELTAGNGTLRITAVYVVVTIDPIIL